MAYSDGRDGKGSRDPFVEPWMQYGQRALSDYLLQNYTAYDNRDPNLNYGVYQSPRGSDPLGIIQDPSRLSAFFDPITARYDELQHRDPYLNYGSEVEPNRVFTPTKDEVQRFIDRQYADFMAAGNPGNDAMWLPRMEGDYVITGLRNSRGGGLLDKITSAFEPAVALSGFAGPALGAEIAAGAAGAAGGAMDMGVGGIGEAMGLGGGAATTGIPTTGLSNLVGGSSSATGGGALNDIIENQGNVTGGGVLGTNYTAGQVGSALGLGSNAGSVLSRILDGTASAGDWARILGTVGSTALGVYGANQQSNALENIANQARADRAPFLNKSLEWMNNPSSYMEGVGKPALDATLRSLSVQGNPFGSPTNLALAGDIANRNWQNAVTGFGNIGLAGQDSRNQLLADSASANRGVTASLASGLGSITQDNSLEGLLRRYGGNSLNLGQYLT